MISALQDKNALKLFFLVDSGYTADVRLLSVIVVFKFSLFCGLNTSVWFIFTLRGLKCLYISFLESLCSHDFQKT